MIQGFCATIDSPAPSNRNVSLTVRLPNTNSKWNPSKYNDAISMKFQQSSEDFKPIESFAEKKKEKKFYFPCKTSFLVLKSMVF